MADTPKVFQPMESAGERPGADLPGRDRYAKIPPGWGYNPASWAQRLPIIILAMIGGAIAFYLTLFQWNVIGSIWDPFFKAEGYDNGSAKILKSPTSEILPFPFTDAFLGFLGYVGDAVTGAIGGTSRWRTMPWIVIVFGILVGPLGAVSIGLVITQPLAYDTFCTLCLMTAVISVLMIGPAMDEMLASLQYMKRVKAHGKPFWRYFWGLGEQEPLEMTPGEPTRQDRRVGQANEDDDLATA